MRVRVLIFTVLTLGISTGLARWAIGLDRQAANTNEGIVVPGIDAERRPPSGKISIVPMPARMVEKEGYFRISADTRIVAEDPNRSADTEKLEAYCRDQIREITGLTLKIDNGFRGNDCIQLKIDTIHTSLGSEGYAMTVDPRQMVIRAEKPAGLFYGIQSLRQILPIVQGQPQIIPACQIEDMPQFQWRGSMLDVSRHFFSKEELEKYIDLLAQYKINVLHLHLTDDQGWRIEIKKYPKLTSIGAWRNENGQRIGGYYTQQCLRDLVAYAADRYITIVPEIDIPGHVQAALAAYPQFSCSGRTFAVDTTFRGAESAADAVLSPAKEETYNFINDILDEVIDIFPSKYIHVGMDEVPMRSWASSVDCQQIMASQGIKNDAGLLGYFARRISEHLTSRNRRMIAWDDVLDSQAPDGSAIMFWRTWLGSGQVRAAAQAGHDIVLAPISAFYLSGDPSLDRLYSYSPENEGFDGDLSKRILGGEAILWTEKISTFSDVESHSVPGLCAFAEAIWTNKAQRNWSNFQVRLQHQYSLFELTHTQVDLPAPSSFADRTLFQNATSVTIDSPEIGSVHYTLTGTDPTLADPLYTGPFSISQSATLKARLFYPNGETGPIRTGSFVKSALVLPSELPQAFPGVKFQYRPGNVVVNQILNQVPIASEGMIDRFHLPRIVRAENYYVNYDGYLHIETEGDYEFATRSDDGSRLWIGNQLVVEDWGMHPSQTRTGRIHLKPGSYPIRIDYVQATEDAELYVSYAIVGSAPNEIPGTALFYPSPGPEPIATSMETYNGNDPKMALDGNDADCFWSNRAPVENDFFTVLFNPPKNASFIEVKTGNNDGTDRLQNGILEISRDGIHYDTVARFARGVASSTVGLGRICGVRIRVTGDQADWLKIRKIRINALNYPDSSPL